MRNLLPASGVLAAILLVCGSAYYVHVANRSGASVLSNDLVTAIERRVSIEMRAYLEPSQKLIQLIDAEVDGRAVFQQTPQAEALVRHALQTVPAATGVSYADTDGNFLYILRNDDGSTGTKLIDRRDGGHRGTWTRRNPAGDVIATEDQPDDTFDPRQRPWYIEAAKARKPIWTDVYQNLSLHKPAISHVIPHYDPDGRLLTVVAIDIELDDLCTFLSRMVIGVTGKAYIVDRTGRIVAYPSADWKPAEVEDTRAPLLDELGDPVLTRVYNRLRVEGFRRMVLDFGDRRVIVSPGPVEMLADQQWLVLIVVPEGDFIGFITDSGLAALALTVAAVAIIVLLAGLLGWRNLAAGRRAAAAASRQEILEERTRVFIDLARDIASKAEGAVSFGNLTEIAAEACSAKRAAVWRLSGDGLSMSCEDSYDAAKNIHSAEPTIYRDEIEVLFSALSDGVVIDTVDEPGHKRSIELVSGYLRPRGIASVFVAPIMLSSHPLGMLSIEDPEGGERAAGLGSFCNALAVLLAFKMSGSVPAGDAQDSKPAAAVPLDTRDGSEAASTEAFAMRLTRLEQTFLRNGISWSKFAGNAIDRTAVGIVKLPEWTSVARPLPESDGLTQMDVIVREVRSAIERNDLNYAVQFDDLIAIAAYSPEKKTASRDARSVARTLLDIRDALSKLEEKWDTELDFKFAIDVGAVMHSAATGDPSCGNLWGGAIGVAKNLAMAAARHAIVASETAYELLARNFLLRPEGTYYMPEVGDMRIFILVGQL
jgi:adenylate cyclase